jgi:hypothetical protein
VALGEAIPAGPDPDRIVRAEVIAQLLLGACEPRTGFVAAVRLSGAYIAGTLDLSGGTVGYELRLTHCRLPEVPDFSNAQTRELRLSDCRMPGFDGGGLRADGYLSLSGSRIEGPVVLNRAQLSGGFRMNGTRITVSDPGDWALTGGAMVVEAGLYGRGCEIDGGVRLTGARMTGGIWLENAVLRNPGRLAMDAQNIVVDDAAEFGRAAVIGTLRLRSARINGILSFSRARLDAGAPDRMALHGSHMQCDELVLWPEQKIKGRVALSYSRINLIMDDPSIWPDLLWLNGLTYETLRGGTFKDRLSWISRDGKFHGQPYEQLATYYHEIGHDDYARKVRLARLRARRRNLNPVGKAWNGLLDWTVGYGYRPWLAFAWFAALVALGTAVFSTDHPRPIKPAGERPDFHAFVYTIDLLIPIDTFGQQQAFDPQGWSRWVAYALIAAGWILATALIAGVTRVLRPN